MVNKFYVYTLFENCIIPLHFSLNSCQQCRQLFNNWYVGKLNLLQLCISHEVFTYISLRTLKIYIKSNL